MTSVANGEFFDLNATGTLGKQHQRLQRIHPGVVRRNRPEPEPDRSHVEGAPPPAPPSPPAPERGDMAGKKKKRTHLDPETWEVAVARVQSLVGAGNTAKDSLASVAKEHGVSVSALAKRYNTAPKPKAPRAKKRRRIEEQIVQHVGRAKDIEPQKLPLMPQAALRIFVQGVVRESIRDEVRIYLNECFGISEDPEAVPLPPGKAGRK